MFCFLVSRPDRSVVGPTFRNARPRSKRTPVQEKCEPKRVCISAPSTSPETSLASLERSRAHLSNDTKIVSGDVDDAKIQTRFGLHSSWAGVGRSRNASFKRIQFRDGMMFGLGKTRLYLGVVDASGDEETTVGKRRIGSFQRILFGFPMR